MSTRRIDYQDFTVIQLDAPTDFCCVCDTEVFMDFGLPMYESEILPNDWRGPWAGFTACRRCFDLFNGITEPIAIATAVRILDCHL